VNTTDDIDSTGTASLAFLEELFEQYRTDPDGVPPDWRAYFEALDSANGADVLRLLATLHAAGRTIVLVTHDPAVAARAARIVELRDGRVIKDTKT
jgi:2-oxoglutarate dehydrogenase complex dehydrogenase (E1) component-like enzyme